MSKKRASLLTLNSFSALSKVRSFSNPIKTLALSKNLSSVAQRSNFDYQGDNSDVNYRNPNEKGLNPDWGFRETNGNVVGDNQIGGSRVSGGSYGGGGDYGNFRGDGFGNSRKVNQNVSGERIGNVSGNHVNISERFQHNHNGVSDVNLRSVNDNVGRGYEYNGNVRNDRGYSNELSLRQMARREDGNHLQGQGSWNSSNAQNGNQFPGSNQHGPWNSQHQQSRNDNVGRYQGNLNCSQNVMEVTQGSWNSSYTQNGNQFQGSNQHVSQNIQHQQNLNAGYSGGNDNVGRYQGNLNGSQNVMEVPQGSWNSSYTQNGNQFRGLNQHGSRNAQHQENMTARYGERNDNVGQYQGNSNGFQNVLEVPQASNNHNVGGLSQSDGSRPYKGTLEELDNFCQQRKMEEAVEVLRLLEEQHVTVDLPLLLQLMQGCGEAKALEEAKAVHNHITRSLSPLSVSTSNKIFEMYAKCGDIDVAFNIFKKMSERDLDSWDTMITWLGKNGLGEDAIDLFSEFKQAGLKPNAHMFIGVFSACSVVGDVHEGMLHFESMAKDYGIIPSMEHYTSVVDMLGSTGYLDEALEFIQKMPIEPSIEIWETLMLLSRIHGNKELGDRCAELVEALDPSRLNEQSKAGLVPVKDSDLAKQKEKKKSGTQNPLEVRSRVHEYRAGDTSHPENDRIYALLRGLRTQMKDAGYIAETRFVLHDIDQESKEDALLAHSERLAAAMAFLTSPARSPVRVIKNLRVCGDCHNGLKIISKIVGRELIMRDAKRFHHFKDGVCSCRDYW
ncbi:Pentatricopeptide repeat (PPR) superfamily protein [Euphorbia peplus]|nr:Pentatricopeptide repeat (PPR) superfamily protein [Euphorbia peplus]